MKERVIRMRMSGNDVVGRLQEHPLVSAGSSKGRHVKLAELHYDTEGLELHRRGMTLVLSRQGKGWVQEIRRIGEEETLSRKGGKSWRCPVSGDDLDTAKLRKAKVARQLLGRVKPNALRLICRVDTDHTAWRVVYPDGTRLLVAAEQGEVIANNLSSAFHDLVLKLEQGDPNRLYQTALTLAYFFKPSLECGLPVERWLGGPIPEMFAVPAVDPVELGNGVSAEKGFVLNLTWAMERLATAHCAVLHGNDPVRTSAMFVVQETVARLLAQLTAHDTVLPVEVRKELDDELTWLLGEVTPACDWELFLRNTLMPFLDHFSQTGGSESVGKTAMTQRGMVQQRMLEALDSFRFTRIYLGLGNWLAGKSWQDLMDLPQKRLMARPAGDVAKSGLDRFHRQLHKLGEGFPEVKGEAMARFLDEGNLLMNTVELFGDLHGGKSYRDYRGDLEVVMAMAAIAREIEMAHEQFSLVTPGEGNPIHFLFHGWLGAQQEGLADDARHAWASFQRRSLYWQ